MEQQLTLDELVSNLLSQIQEYGLKEISIRDYAAVCSNLKRFADRKGDDVYSKGLVDEFDAYEAERCIQKGVRHEHMRFVRRVLRLLTMLAETGEADFRPHITRKKYIVSDSAQQLVREILDYHGLSGGVRAKMDTVIRHLFSYAEEKEIQADAVTDELLMDFFVMELPKTNSGSMRRSLQAIKYVSSYLALRKQNCLTLDFSQINTRSASSRTIPPYSQDEIRKILGVIDTSTAIGMRDYAVIMLAFETGIRGIDIRKLCLQDIDWTGGRIFVNQSKTAEPLILPLTGRTMNAIADYILKARPECKCSEVFLDVKSPVRPMGKEAYDFSWLIGRYCRKAGVAAVPGRGFHSLRRSFATGLSAAGIPIETISQMLGHRQMKSDRPYLSYNREQISFCSLGFDDVPIKNGVYSQLPENTAGGGDSQ